MKFFNYKKWKMFPKKLFDTSSWGMVKALHAMLLEATKITFVIANYIVINVDEVTTIDNTQWLSIHLYGPKVEKDFNPPLC